MTTTKRILVPTAVDPLPPDLRDWLSRNTLVRLALDAVQNLSWPTPAPTAHPAGGFSQRMMATLLTYCYATGTFGSQDIEAACELDPTVRYICAREYPDWRNIRRFRRDHADLLRQSLTYVLLQAWAWRVDQAEAEYPGYDWIEYVLAERVEASANIRVEAAGIVDTAMLDF